jgi:hypothetical protein
MTNRPRIDKEQMDQLKSDIKLLSRLIIAEFKCYKTAKYPATSTQNAYARQFGFDSFSEMSMLMVATTHHSTFSLACALSAPDLLNVYENLNHQGGKTDLLEIGHINNALVEFKTRKNKPEMPTITLALLRDIINESEYCQHTYTENCGFPNEFNVEPTAEFFDTVNHEDHILVVDGGEKKYYTIAKFEHMYTKRKVFKVLSGKWWNIDESPFCSGQS